MTAIARKSGANLPLFYNTRKLIGLFLRNVMFVLFFFCTFGTKIQRKSYEKNNDNREHALVGW